jgi:hypothetical protein
VATVDYCILECETLEERWKLLDCTMPKVIVNLFQTILYHFQKIILFVISLRVSHRFELCKNAILLLYNLNMLRNTYIMYNINCWYHKFAWCRVSKKVCVQYEDTQCLNVPVRFYDFGIVSSLVRKLMTEILAYACYEYWSLINTMNFLIIRCKSVILAFWCSSTFCEFFIFLKESRLPVFHISVFPGY